MPDKTKTKTIPRPPVIVVMGHIDHGKSTLLDYIRKTNIVSGEAGGITQHVGAYQAEFISENGKRHALTFLDTPGHAAFFNIRERGAKAADIAILIVSAEDGVKPQTMEAYKSIVAEKIPYIVAITKIDKPNADIDKTKQSLGENEIYVEGWGGDVPCVAISSITGQDIPELLEMILLIAELANLKTNPEALASGFVVESSLDTKKGISATLLIKNGKLEIGSFVVAEDSYAPVRFIEDFNGLKIESAGAAMPVRVLGWNRIPSSGAIFSTVKNKKEAEKLAQEFTIKKRNSAGLRPHIAAPSTNTEESGTAIVSLPIIIKADVIGSLEGARHELSKIKHDKVKIDIVSQGIGDINENDVKTALSDPNILILGFNSKPDSKARPLIERSSIPITVMTFSIIYELSEFVRNTVLSKVPKEYEERVTGRAKIQALFSKEKNRQVVGGKVEIGTLESGDEIRIMRRETEIGRGKIRELQSKKLRVTEVAEGFEFGMLVESKMEIAPGDKIESVKTVEVTAS